MLLYAVDVYKLGCTLHCANGRKICKKGKESFDRVSNHRLMFLSYEVHIILTFSIAYNRKYPNHYSFVMSRSSYLSQSF